MSKVSVKENESALFNNKRGFMVREDIVLPQEMAKHGKVMATREGNQKGRVVG